MATLIQNAAAVKAASTAIDAAIVAKGGSTAGGLTNAAAAIAALPSGGGGGYVRPNDWPHIDEILAANSLAQQYSHKFIMLFDKWATSWHCCGVAGQSYITSESPTTLVDASTTQDVALGSSYNYKWIIVVSNSYTFAASRPAIWVHCDNAQPRDPIEDAMIFAYNNYLIEVSGTADLSSSGRYGGNPTLDLFFINDYSLRKISEDLFGIAFYGMNSTFAYCYCLTEIPEIDVSRSTTFRYTFSKCTSIKSIPEVFDMSACTTSYSDMLSGATAIQRLPDVLDLSSITSFTVESLYCLDALPTHITTKIDMDFSNSRAVSRDSVAVITDGVVTGGLAKYISLPTGSSATPTIRLASLTKSKFSTSEQQIVADAFTANGFTLAW